MEQEIISDVTLGAIRAEALRASILHPKTNGGVDDPVRAVAILTEEVGELAAEVLAATRPSNAMHAGMVRLAWEQAEVEAIQVAAVAARIVELAVKRQREA